MKNKGHHYITESYQRLFSDRKEQITVLTPEGKIFTTNPENTFKEDHFNTVKLPGGGGTLVVEKTLSQIEGAFIAVVKDKIHKRQPLSKEDRLHVAYFVAAMFNRTKVHREHVRGFFQNLKDSMVGWRERFKAMTPRQRAIYEATPSNGETSITYEELEEGLKDFDSYQAMSILSGVTHTTPILAGMEWMLLEAPEGKEFLSSDNPLCLCSPAREKKYGSQAFGAQAGLRHADVELTLPLSKKFALVATWDKKGGEYALATSRMVDQINYRTARGAENLFSASKILLEELLAKFPAK